MEPDLAAEVQHFQTKPLVEPGFCAYWCVVTVGYLLPSLGDQGKYEISSLPGCAVLFCRLSHFTRLVVEMCEKAFDRFNVEDHSINSPNG